MSRETIALGKTVTGQAIEALRTVVSSSKDIGQPATITTPNILEDGGVIVQAKDALNEMSPGKIALLGVSTVLSDLIGVGLAAVAAKGVYQFVANRNDNVPNQERRAVFAAGMAGVGTMLTTWLGTRSAYQILVVKDVGVMPIPEAVLTPTPIALAANTSQPDFIQSGSSELSEGSQVELEDGLREASQPGIAEKEVINQMDSTPTPDQDGDPSEWLVPSLADVSIGRGGQEPEWVAYFRYLVGSGLINAGAEVGVSGGYADAEFHTKWTLAGEVDAYRWTVLPRNKDGEVLWATYTQSGVTSFYSYPYHLNSVKEGGSTVLSLNTTDFQYVSVPDSQEAEIVYPGEFPVMVKGEAIIGEERKFKQYFNTPTGEWRYIPEVMMVLVPEDLKDGINRSGLSLGFDVEKQMLSMRKDDQDHLWLKQSGDKWMVKTAIQKVDGLEISDLGKMEVGSDGVLKLVVDGMFEVGFDQVIKHNTEDTFAILDSNVDEKVNFEFVDGDWKNWDLALMDGQNFDGKARDLSRLVDYFSIAEGAITQNYIRNEIIRLSRSIIKLRGKGDGLELRGHVKIAAKDVVIIDIGSGRMIIQLKTTKSTVNDQLTLLRLPDISSKEYGVKVYHSVKSLDPAKASRVIEEFDTLLKDQGLTQVQLKSKIDELNRGEPDWDFFRNTILYGMINDT